MPQARPTLLGAGVAAVLWGCAGGTRAAPVRPATGPLDIRIVYPRPSERRWDGTGWLFLPDSTVRIQSRDSAFVFGSVSRADARLIVNGHEVSVHPGGGWIAWLPLDEDSLARFDLVATVGTELVRATYLVPLEPRYQPPWFGPWIDTTSFAPSGEMWVGPDEDFTLAVRATPGAAVRLVAPDGRNVPMLPDVSPRPLSAGERAFGTVPRLEPGQPRADRYVVTWSGSFGPDPGPALAQTSRAGLPDSVWGWVEITAQGDTARARWPLRVARSILGARRSLWLTMTLPPPGSRTACLRVGRCRTARTTGSSRPARLRR